MEVLGLPAHPFFVHVPVIIVPLAAVLWLATGWRSELRRWFIVPILVLAIAGGIGAVFAANSGEDLDESVEDDITRAEEDRIEEHEEAGELARNGALAFMAVTIVAAGVVYLGDVRQSVPRWAPLAAFGVAAVFGILATASMVNAGHSGAEAVWKDRAKGEERTLAPPAE